LAIIPEDEEDNKLKDFKVNKIINIKNKLLAQSIG